MKHRLSGIVAAALALCLLASLAALPSASAEAVSGGSVYQEENPLLRFISGLRSMDWNELIRWIRETDWEAKLQQVKEFFTSDRIREVFSGIENGFSQLLQQAREKFESLKNAVREFDAERFLQDAENKVYELESAAEQWAGDLKDRFTAFIESLRNQ